jgi:menaquinone-dependent protoporphyrinogen IX oxidase
MKSIVIYKSKTGFTEGYAEWIGEALGCPVKTADSVKTKDLTGYDTIIYGGGVYASSISGVKLITKNLDALKDKNLVVWANGARAVTDEWIKELKENNFKGEQAERIKFFYMRGGLDYNKLGTASKIIIKGVSKMMENEKNADSDNPFKGDLKEIKDFRTKENIQDLVAYVKSL